MKNLLFSPVTNATPAFGWKRRAILPALAVGLAFSTCLNAQITLGPTLATFGGLAGSTLTNTGPSSVGGNIGVSPGSAITGFPPGVVIGGSINAANGLAATAQGELTAAYNAAAGAASTALVSADIGGQTLPAGVYTAASSLGISGTVTLNGGGNSNAQFIFQVPSALTTGPGSAVLLINGAQASNVFWVIGSSATLGTTSIFAGNILAFTSISINTGASLNGRALARNGAVTMDSNIATVPLLATGDVSVSKTGPNGVVSGQNAVYTVIVTNNGSGAAAGVSVADPTPSNLTFVSNTGGCGTAYPCVIGSMTAGQSIAITSTYSTSSAFSGTVTNTATVSATSTDSNATNNTASKATNIGQQADLSIVKTGPASVLPNTDITYTITVTNAGPSAATTSTVTDTLPSTLTFVSATASQGSCSGTATVTCSLGTVANGGTATITLVAHVVASTPASTSIVNSASVTSAINDPTPANNSSTATATASPASVPALSSFAFGLLALALAGLAARLLQTPARNNT